MTAETGYPLLAFELAQEEDLLRYTPLPLVVSEGRRIFVLAEGHQVELSGLLQAGKGPAVVEVVVAGAWISCRSLALEGRLS